MATAFKKFLSYFQRDDSGATAIEYVMIAAGVSIGIIAVVTVMGVNLSALVGKTAGGF